MVKKVNAIDASKLVRKTDCNRKFKEIEDKILNHAKNTTSANFNELTKKIFDERLELSNLATKSNLDTVLHRINETEKNMVFRICLFINQYSVC